MSRECIIFLLLSILLQVTSFVRIPFVHALGAPIILKSPSALLAHHVNKKITKRMMDRRPKKTRPSDIHRNNVNFGKCITKVVGAPPDYTIVAEKDIEAARAASAHFWEFGSPDDEWIYMTEDCLNTGGLRNSLEPPPKGTMLVPPLVKSGTW